MDALHNQTIGEYTIVGHINSGGMGEVYRGVHTRLGRTVAIKMLKHSDPNLMASERFINEARIQSSLNHPNIALLYEYFESHGHPCIVMEYVDGETLDELIGKGGGMPLQQALSHFARIVEAIQYIHERGIVHRDIKPSNIKVNSAGEIKLLDFGIAKASFSSKLTQDGRFIGTVQYLSPEQLKGQPATVQSDVWALGALLYEMVTGKPAFESNSWEGLCKKISEASYTAPSELAPSVPRSLERVIANCLRKAPSQRYASARALVDDIYALDYADYRAPKAHRASPGAESLFSRCWRDYKAATVGVLLLLLTFAVGGVFLFSGLEPQPTPRPIPISRPMVEERSGPIEPQRTAPPVAETLSEKGRLPKASEIEKPQEQEPPPAKGPLRPVSISVFGAPANLYLRRGDKWEGPHQTPYIFQAPEGGRVEWVLKRLGYKDKKGAFNVQVTNQYTYQMCKEGEYCPDE